MSDNKDEIPPMLRAEMEVLNQTAEEADDPTPEQETEPPFDFTPDESD